MSVTTFEDRASDRSVLAELAKIKYVACVLAYIALLTIAVAIIALTGRNTSL